MEAIYHTAQDSKNKLRADPLSRQAVSYDSDALTIAAHLYQPDGAANCRTAGIVMCGSVSSVKEQTLRITPDASRPPATRCLPLTPLLR
jgi:hypothetical protein